MRVGGDILDPHIYVFFENYFIKAIDRFFRFPFTENFGKFPLGISVMKERVPFVTSSIRGRPGRLKDRERYGTGDKDEKSREKMEHK